MPPPRIFISYRRESAGAHAGRLADAIVQRWGEDAVFLDVESIGPGEDFAAQIAAVIERSDVVLVLVGPGWAEVPGADGSRRLDDPADLVRVEVASALRGRPAVVPVLVGAASLPGASDLPEDLRPLLQRNAAVLEDRSWRHDVERLLEALEPSPPPTAGRADTPVGAPEATAAGDLSVSSAGERKLVSVLSASLEPSGQTDPEDWRGLLAVGAEQVGEAIVRFGGTVLAQVGGAITGVFGAPRAHEDDAERAVRAGLRICREVSAIEATIRIGVATAEALVSAAGDGEVSVTGNVLGEAIRLGNAGATAQVMVDAPTRLLTSRAISYGEPAIGEVQAFAALGPVARSRSYEPDRTPFLGRGTELRVLSDLFDRSRARSTVEVATVVAEPGLGKSRLVRELFRHVDDAPELVTWREGRCPPYGEGIGFWALGEIIKAQAGILDTDDQLTVGTKLDAAIAEPDPQTRAWMADRLAPLVGRETRTAPPEQQEAFTAWRRFLEQIVATGPTVLVIEDLHWADPGFVAFLEHLVEHVAGVPLLLVVTARPELAERHPSWPPGRRSSVLSLGPLDDDALETLVATELPGAAPGLTRLVRERAGGSPLYAEQLVAMLRERALPLEEGGLDASLIPTSVQTLIAARIDQLPPEPKRVLMQASVVGKSFWSGAVAAVGEHAHLEASLSELVRRELVRPVHPSTMEGYDEFSFWHALVRDVAYGELTRADRARMHAATARWIEDRAAGGKGEHAEIVVHHLDAALELAPSAPELDVAAHTDRLVEALIRAGEAAMRTRVERAIPFLERSLLLLPPGDHRRASATLLLGRVYLGMGRHAAAAELLEQLLDAQLEQGDLASAADTAVYLSAAWFRMGNPAKGDALLKEIGARLEPSPSRALATIIAAQANALLTLRDYEAVRRLAARSIEMADGLGIDPPPFAMASRGLARVMLGDPGGEVDVHRSVHLLVGAGETERAVVVMVNTGNALYLAGGPAAGLIQVEEAMAFAERSGMEGLSNVCRALRLEHLAELGGFATVIAESDAVLGWAAKHQHVFARSAAQTGLAHVELDAGGHGVGPSDMIEASARLDDKRPLLFAALLALAQSEDEVARSLLPECAGVAEQSDAYRVTRACVAAGLPGLAEGLLTDGEAHYPIEEAARQAARALLDESVGHLETACSGYECASEAYAELGMAPDHARTLQGLGRCLLKLGEIDTGIARLREARRLWVEMEATPRIAEIDALLSRAR